VSWPFFLLSECVIDMHQGINTITEAIEYQEDGTPIIQSKHITKGYLDLNETRFVNTATYQKYSEKYNPKINDILLCNIGTIGKSILINKEDKFLIAWNIFLIKLKERIIDPSYLKHYLDFLFSKNYFDKFLTGGTVKFISKKTLLNIQIPVPPLEEQQRIAKILNKAEEIKHKSKLLAANLEIVSNEIFVNMFSDLLEKPNATLGSVFDVRDGTHDSPKSQTEGYPLITSKNLNNNSINLEDVSFINLEDFEAINRRSKVDYCDILMPMIGTIGNPIIVHDKNPQFAIKNVALIKTGNLEASFYVKGLLETQCFERYVSKESKGGTQKFLSLGNIRNFPINIPSDEQLLKFSKISRALIQLQSSLDKSQRKLDELLSSLQFSFMTSN
jgi:type I restriction enzyme S subunit